MLDNLGEEDTVTEIARNVSFGPTEGNLVDPVVDHLQIIFSDFGCSAGADDFLEVGILLLLLHLHERSGVVEGYLLLLVVGWRPSNNKLLLLLLL